MSVLDRIQRRLKYPVELECGTVYIRPLGYWDKAAVRTLSDVTDQVSYAVGRCLIEEDGTLVLEPGKDESAKEFALRVREISRYLSPKDIATLSEAITKITTAPPVEAVSKNSDATASQDS
jgi:hypothetical protein